MTQESSFNSVRNWEQTWITFRCSQNPIQFTVRLDIAHMTEQQKNLIANRGRFPVNTADSQNSTEL